MRRLTLSVVAIMAMLGAGFITRYCGMDATMGMAMAHTGVMFPLFGTMIGWLGVALSGTGRRIERLIRQLPDDHRAATRPQPHLMGAANSAGGVMGKMIAAQSLVIGCAATGQQGQEGLLFRAVLKHSLALGLLVGLIVLLYAYVFPRRDSQRASLLVALFHSSTASNRRVSDSIDLRFPGQEDWRASTVA